MQIQLAVEIGLIFIIALFILVPINMVKSKIYERQSYLEQAKLAVTDSWTGPQLLTTPVIAIPYSQSGSRSASGFYDNVDLQHRMKVLYIMPEKSLVEGLIKNRILHKGIYAIPVYRGELQISANFCKTLFLDKLASLKKIPGVEEIHSPYLALPISDVRGVDQEPRLSINDQELTVEAGSRLRE